MSEIEPSSESLNITMWIFVFVEFRGLDGALGQFHGYGECT